MNFRDDGLLTNLGQTVRQQCHTRLADSKLLFLFRSEAAKSKGRVRLGAARKPGALLAFLCHKAFGVSPDFIIEIAEDCWELLTANERLALLDHELQHCHLEVNPKTGEIKTGLVGHDVEEFGSVLARRGAWRPDLKRFIDTARQLDLFGGTPRDVAAGTDGSVADVAAASGQPFNDAFANIIRKAGPPDPDPPKGRGRRGRVQTTVSMQDPVTGETVTADLDKVRSIVDHKTRRIRDHKAAAAGDDKDRTS
jgi:hypothetical protein